MKKAIIPLQLIFNLNSKLFLNATAGITDEMAAIRPNDQINNVVFISAHLLDARYYISDMLDLKVVNPFKDVFEKVSRVEDSDQLPGLSKIRSTWGEVSQKLSDHLTEVSAEILCREAPFKFPVADPTILGATTFLISHESYHLGQLGILRKYLDLPAMKYD
jgi:uncharacterized damage-inducible protein DinB